MIPLSTVQGTGESIEARQARPGPSEGIQHAATTEHIHLALVPVRERIAQLDHVGEVRLVAPSPSSPAPVPVVQLELRAQVGEAEPSEVSPQAPEVSVSPIDVAALGRCSDQERLEAHIRLSELHEFVGTQIVQVSHETLELSHHSEQIGMRDRATDLQRASRSAVELAEFGMRQGEHVDGSPTLVVPALQRQ